MNIFLIYICIYILVIYLLYILVNMQEDFDEHHRPAPTTHYYPPLPTTHYHHDRDVMVRRNGQTAAMALHRRHAERVPQLQSIVIV